LVGRYFSGKEEYSTNTGKPTMVFTSKSIPTFIVKCNGKQIGKIFIDRTKCEEFLESVRNEDNGEDNKYEIVEGVWYI
jgi:hypothetical protein